jgi:Protein-L-isoaspartate(D-aspartate) O-methyltransferase (PCMT)
MYGWQVPPPRAPTKSREELRREREQKVQRLLAQGLLRSERIKVAMLKVAREDFLPHLYRDYAYCEVPLPLPGELGAPLQTRRLCQLKTRPIRKWANQRRRQNHCFLPMRRLKRSATG